MKQHINIDGPMFKDYCTGFREEIKNGLYRSLTMIFYPRWWVTRFPEDPTTELGWIKFGLSRLPFIFTILGEHVVYGTRQGFIELCSKVKNKYE